MTSADNKLWPAIQPTRSRSGATASRGEDNGSLRWKIRIGAIALLIVNLGVGLFARQQQHALIDYAVNVYDTAFISTNYIHFAQMSFQHYVDERLSATTADERSKAGEGLGNVLDNLDVAIERADTSRSREMARDVRAKIAALADNNADAADLTPQLGVIQQDLQHLASHASAAGLQARDDIEGLSSRSDVLLSISVGPSIIMIIVALLLLQRLITQAQRVRREAAEKDTEIAAAAQRQALLREQELAAKSIQADRMGEALDSFMQRMMEPTEQLHVAAKDLNSSAESLSEMRARQNPSRLQPLQLPTKQPPWFGRRPRLATNWQGRLPKCRLTPPSRPGLPPERSAR